MLEISLCKNATAGLHQSNTKLEVLKTSNSDVLLRSRGPTWAYQLSWYSSRFGWALWADWLECRKFHFVCCQGNLPIVRREVKQGTSSQVCPDICDHLVLESLSPCNKRLLLPYISISWYYHVVCFIRNNRMRWTVPITKKSQNFIMAKWVIVRYNIV